MKGIPSPREYTSSIKIPDKTEPCCDANIRAEPRNAPTHGVHPRAKIKPNKNADRNPSGLTSLFMLCVLLNKPILNTPMKLNPKKITIAPVTILTIV